MKTIAQVVAEEVTKVMKGKPDYYRTLVNRDVKDKIIAIDRIAKKIKEGKSNYVDSDIYYDYYHLRCELVRLDLWDERYDECYASAHQGQLDINKLKRIIVK
ncbi:MAG: hypothetical protein NTU63_01740 [Candidatus Pacearchaeota archaeon]|nr:hypothetical protein [Candidatus Pacearchaeota archaeon]